MVAAVVTGVAKAAVAVAVAKAAAGCRYVLCVVGRNILGSSGA